MFQAAYLYQKMINLDTYNESQTSILNIITKSFNDFSLNSPRFYMI